MKKQLILLFTLIFTGIFSAAAQDPIYVVNGQVVSDIRNIPPGDIESTEMLPADEQTIARYGTEASTGFPSRMAGCQRGAFSTASITRRRSLRSVASSSSVGTVLPSVVIL